MLNKINTYFLLDIYNLLAINTNLLFFSIILIILMILVLSIIHIYSFEISFFFKFFTMTCYSVLMYLYFFKFFLNIYYFNYISSTIYIQLSLVKISFFKSFYILPVNSALFSDCIVCLSFFIGYMCLSILGNKGLFIKFNNLLVFYLFNLITIIMVYTTNLLLMFLMFECLLLPTLYYIYIINYSKKSDKSVKYLIWWTLWGMLIILFLLAYIFGVYKTLDFKLLGYLEFTKLERIVLFILLVLGFSVKMPLIPFQYWLLKIHVESSTGFSLFLSGFLVKAAIFCFYSFFLLFQSEMNRLLVIIWVIISLVVATISLLFQLDLKHLVAWATIQEMTTIFLLLLLRDFYTQTIIFIFILFHGIISVYMFYLVDIIERRLNTRQLISISGLSTVYPKLTLYIWIGLFFFSGFPFTPKFLIELEVITSLLEINSYIFLIILLIIHVISVISVCKNLFSILYGQPYISDLLIVDLTKKEVYILNTLFSLFLLLFIFFSCIY